MRFIAKKIKEKTTPFLKVKNPNLFFGPEIVKKPKKNIFQKIPFFLIVGFLFFFFYLFLILRVVLSPPEIIIYFPPNNYITKERIITIIGESEKNSLVTINDKSVILKENKFEEKITLSEGLNLIKISAKKKFGPERTIFRQIIAK
jgi:hypothetical protein